LNRLVNYKTINNLTKYNERRNEMFGDFMNKMQEAQKQMEVIKKRLEGVYVEGVAENGLVKVTANANKKIINISISNEILNDKEAVEDLLIVAINKALEKAENVNNSEMGSVAQGMIPGLF